jgi:cytidylate kinase
LAAALGYVYVDTGAMYRAVAYFAMQHNLVSEAHLDTAGLIAQLPSIHLRFQFNPTLGYAEMYLNNENIETQIRTIEVSRMVSKVAEVSEVRAKLVEQQQAMGKDKGIVMDGRDIGTVVFPNAELKIFMTAAPEVRAERRHKELLAANNEVSYQDVYRNLMERDEQDSTRSVSPLRKSTDATEVDTSHITREEQLSFILNLAEERIKKA